MSQLENSSSYSKEAKADRRISRYVIYYFIASALNATIKHAFVLSGGLYRATSVLIGLSIVFFMVVPIRDVWRRSGKLLLETIGLFVVVYLVSFCMSVFRGDSLSILLRDSAFLTFAWWIPVGVYACSVVDKKILYETGLKGSFVISVLMVVLWFSGNHDTENAEYSMFMGFAIILPLLFHINEFFRCRSVFYLLVSILEFFMVLAFANRGVLLSVFAFVLFKIVFETSSTTIRIVLIILVSLISAFMFLFFEQIVLSLVSLMSALGVVSRTLNMALADNIADSSGREGIWRICINMFYEKPFFGWGLGGEFIEIARRMGAVPGEIGAGYSPHNGIIQNFVNFGFAGGLVASAIVIKPLLSINRVKYIFTNHLIAIYACASIIPCLVSADGLFTKPAVAVALLLYYQRNRFNKKNETNN